MEVSQALYFINFYNYFQKKISNMVKNEIEVLNSL